MSYKSIYRDDNLYQRGGLLAPDRSCEALIARYRALDTASFSGLNDFLKDLIIKFDQDASFKILHPTAINDLNTIDENLRKFYQKTKNVEYQIHIKELILLQINTLIGILCKPNDDGLRELNNLHNQKIKLLNQLSRNHNLHTYGLEPHGAAPAPAPVVAANPRVAAPAPAPAPVVAANPRAAAPGVAAPVVAANPRVGPGGFAPGFNNYGKNFPTLPDPKPLSPKLDPKTKKWENVTPANGVATTNRRNLKPKQYDYSSDDQIGGAEEENYLKLMYKTYKKIYLLKRTH